MTSAAVPAPVGALFAGWEETIVWSCLQGVMGEVQTNADGTAAVALLGDFAFFAGKPDTALVQKCGLHPGQLLVPHSAEWMQRLRAALDSRVRLHERYATAKDPTVFDRARLAAMARVPEGYLLRPINGAMTEQLRQAAWSRDLVANYRDAAHFDELGMGVVLLRQGVPVAGASSYSSYRGGIEIEIDTHPAHRRKGLATVCGAALILGCLDRGMYPSWDAHTPISLALAQKLGYHYTHSYQVLEVIGATDEDRK